VYNLVVRETIVSVGGGGCSAWPLAVAAMNLCEPWLLGMEWVDGMEPGAGGRKSF
jgi:hypothetical protein